MLCIPENWTPTILEEVIDEYQAGFACGKKHTKNGLTHLRMNNIGIDGKLNLELIRKVPATIAKDHHYLKKGDILFCTTNSAKLVGKCAVFDLEEKCAFSNHLTRLRVDRGIISNKLLQLYLWYLWQTGEFESKCKHWVNQSTLPKEKLVSTIIPLPPLNEQRRIVAKLEKLLQKLGDCKGRLEKIPPILKHFRQSVLSAACSGRLTADWRKEHPDVEPASEILKRIQEERKKRYKEECSNTKIRGLKKPLPYKYLSDNIPNFKFEDHWIEVPLDFIFKMKNGKSLTSKMQQNGDIPVYGGNGLNGYHNNYNSNEQTIIVGRVGAQCGNVHFVEGKSWVTDNAIALESTFKILPEFYSYLLKSMNLNQLSGGTGQPYVSQEILGPLSLPLPPLIEQQEIIRRVEALFKIADRIEEHYQKAVAHIDKLMQSILAKAFRGELVPQDPNDEPASILLERIREERAKKQAQMKVNKKITSKSKGKRKKKE